MPDGAICPFGTRIRNLYHIATEQSEVISHLLAENISHERKRVYRQKCRSIGRGRKTNEKSIKELALDLTVEVTAMCDVIKGRSVFVNQLLRSCSSIGANAHEAKYAQSKADFINKLEIALKECYETEYWLEVLYRVHSISETDYKSLLNKCGTIRRKLIASVTTVKQKEAKSAVISRD